MRRCIQTFNQYHILIVLFVRLVLRYTNSGRLRPAHHLNDLCSFHPLYQAAEDEEEPEGRASSEEESSDDDKSWVEEVREQRRLLRQEDRDRRRQERKDADRNTVLLEREQNGTEETSNVATSKKTSQPQFYQIKAGEEFRSFNDMARKQKLQKYVFENVSNEMVR